MWWGGEDWRFGRLEGNVNDGVDMTWFMLCNIESESPGSTIK